MCECQGHIAVKDTFTQIRNDWNQLRHSFQIEMTITPLKNISRISISRFEAWTDSWAKVSNFHFFTASFSNCFEVIQINFARVGFVSARACNKTGLESLGDEQMSPIILHACVLLFIHFKKQEANVVHQIKKLTFYYAIAVQFVCFVKWRINNIDHYTICWLQKWCSLHASSRHCLHQLLAKTFSFHLHFQNPRIHRRWYERHTANSSNPFLKSTFLFRSV